MFELEYGETVTGTVTLKDKDLGEVISFSGSISLYADSAEGLGLRIADSRKGLHFVTEELVGAVSYQREGGEK